MPLENRLTPIKKHHCETAGTEKKRKNEDLQKKTKTKNSKKVIKLNYLSYWTIVFSELFAPGRTNFIHQFLSQLVQKNTL